MTTEKIIVRGLRPEDMGSFTDLCESRDDFDRDAAERLAAKVEWIAFHNPAADGEPTYIVGAQGDRIVGHLGRMPTHFSIDGRIEKASYFHDLYVHPDIRKKGAQGFFLTMRMYDAAEKASPSFCVMIWTNEINIALQKSRKYKQMWTVNYYKILNLNTFIDKRAPTFIAYFAKPLIRKLLTAKDKMFGLMRRNKYTVVRHKNFDARFDELAKHSAPELGIAPYKDSAYLNWKYINRPGIEATPYLAQDKTGRLVGYIVVVDHIQSASIAELVALNNDTSLIGTLVDSAINHARMRTGISRIRAVATDIRYARALKSRFFFVREKPEPLFLAKVDCSENQSLLLNTKNWHMSLGDSEGPF